MDCKLSLHLTSDFLLLSETRDLTRDSFQTGSPNQIYRPLEEEILDDYDWLGGEMTHEELRSLADLLRQVLVMNPTERKTAGEVAEHPWLLDRSRK